MGSSYFGEPRLGNGRSNSGSSSSKKGKRSNLDKPKQPQRGLGVAQLEKIRLHHQIGCDYVPSLYHHNLNQDDVIFETTYSSVPSSSTSSFSYPSSTTSFGYHTNIMMGFREMEGHDIRYNDSQSCTTARWNQHNGILETHQGMQQGMTREFFCLNMEDNSVHKKKIRKDERSNSMGSSSQNSADSSEMQELDLDLKLSL